MAQSTVYFIFHVIYKHLFNHLDKNVILTNLNHVVESMTTHRQTTDRHNDSPTVFFHRQPTHRHDHWLTRQVTDTILKSFKKSPTHSQTVMHQSFVSPAPPLTYGDSGASVRGIDLLSSPAVPGKCWACVLRKYTPMKFTLYKEQGYDSQQVPTLQGF